MSEQPNLGLSAENINLKSFKCSLCDNSFLQESQLKRHLLLRKFLFEARLQPEAVVN